MESLRFIANVAAEGYIVLIIDIIKQKQYIYKKLSTWFYFSYFSGAFCVCIILFTPVADPIVILKCADLSNIKFTF